MHIPTLRGFLITASLSLAMLLGIVGVYWLQDDSETAKASANGPIVLLVSQSDLTDAGISAQVEKFRAKGFTVSSDRTATLAAVDSGQASAFIVTRDALNSVPAQTWATLYRNHAVVGGLDVSLGELQPLAAPQVRVGPARLKYTAGRPIFSLMFDGGNCLVGAMSDWLAGYDVAAVAISKAQRIQEVPVTEQSKACSIPTPAAPISVPSTIPPAPIPPASTPVAPPPPPTVPSSNGGR